MFGLVRVGAKMFGLVRVEGDVWFGKGWRRASRWMFFSIWNDGMEICWLAFVFV